MLFLVPISLKKSMWNLLLVTLILQIRFANLAMPCMALNRHREHGMRSSVPQSSNLVLMPVLMTFIFYFCSQHQQRMYSFITLCCWYDYHWRWSDMIIIGDDLTSIIDLNAFLQHHFEMKDHGHLSFFIDLEVLSDSSSYYPS